MNEKQEAEWNKAQKISIGVDLIAVAQKQLEFLAAVDRRQWLYESPAVEQAVYRYKAYWLPLLAKQSENGGMDDPLVVPLDCEWIWHCHRLNPVQYKMDCEKVYGKILDCKNVTSSVQFECKKQAEETWARSYPDEPFELDYDKIFSNKVVDINAGAAGVITYDLVAAVQRQSTFYYQVSRPSMLEPRFLTEALRRYKGFLHLIRNNEQLGCVPTYDIDLMWHSHQLCPASYCNDMMALVGMVVQHDDSDSDRSIGNNLHDSFTETTKQFEETFGLRYWRAGAMYRGAKPTPLTTVPIAFNQAANGGGALQSGTGFLCLPFSRVVQVFLEIVEVKNAPTNESENLYVCFTQKQPDMYFSGDGILSILSLTGEKDVADFQCEPTGGITLTLIAKSHSKPDRILGTTVISLEELTDHNSKLLMEKWFKLKPDSQVPILAPIYLRVAASSSVPELALPVLHMVRLEEKVLSSPFGTYQNVNYWTSIVDGCGKTIARIQMRPSTATKQDNCLGERQVVGEIACLQKPVILAVGQDNRWSLNDISNLYGPFEFKTSQDGTFLGEIQGQHVIKIYSGKKLEYEDKCCRVHNEDSTFITAVQFSNKNPYGKAIALLDMKAKTLKVHEEWFVAPWITLSLILMEMFGREANTHVAKNTKDMCTDNNIGNGAKSVQGKMCTGCDRADGARCCWPGDTHTGSNIADGAKCIQGGMRTGSGRADGVRCCWLGDTHTGSNIADGAKCIQGGMRNIADGAKCIQGGMRTGSGRADGVRCCWLGDTHTGSNIADGAKCIQGGMRNIADGAKCIQGGMRTGSGTTSTGAMSRQGSICAGICHGLCGINGAMSTQGSVCGASCYCSICTKSNGVVSAQGPAAGAY